MAPLNICVYKITDRAGDAWSAFEGANAKLWQIQMEHAARPSCLFDLRGTDPTPLFGSLHPPVLLKSVNTRRRICVCTRMNTLVLEVVLSYSLRAL